MSEAGRSPPSKGEIEPWFTEIDYTPGGNHVFMTFYIFSVAVLFLPFNWWQVLIFFFFSQLRFLPPNAIQTESWLEGI